MPRSKYPDEIELVDPDFSTTERRIAAKEIKDKWPIDFQDLAAEGDYSRGHYQNVYYEYFGPRGVGKTFREIQKEFGDVAEFIELYNRKNEFKHYLQQEIQSCTDITSLIGTDDPLLLAYLKGLRNGFEIRDDLASENPDETKLRNRIVHGLASDPNTCVSDSGDTIDKSEDAPREELQTIANDIDE